MIDDSRDLQRCRDALVEADNLLCRKGFEYKYSDLHDLIWKAIDILDEKLRKQ